MLPGVVDLFLGWDCRQISLFNSSLGRTVRDTGDLSVDFDTSVLRGLTEVFWSSSGFCTSQFLALVMDVVEDFTGEEVAFWNMIILRVNNNIHNI